MPLGASDSLQKGSGHQKAGLQNSDADYSRPGNETPQLPSQ